MIDDGLRIKNFFGTNQEEVNAKKFNPFLAISLGNQYFSRKNVQAYLEWCFKNCNGYVAVLVCDTIHAINYEVLKNQQPDDAMKRAIELGNHCLLMLEKIQRDLKPDCLDRLTIARWPDAEKTESFRHAYPILKQFYLEDSDFRNAIQTQMKQNLGNLIANLEPREIDRLSDYLLNEVAVFVNGLWISAIRYDMNLYPGAGFSKLIVDIQDGQRFPDLSQKLQIKYKVAYLEAYVD